MKRANHKNALTERNAEIIRRAQCGEHLSAIGRDYGITRERVRQIAARAGVNVVSVRKALREKERAEARARTALRKRGRRDAMAAELRAFAHRLGHTPTFLDIVRADRTTIRSGYLYQRVFGSMRNAQIAAGLTPNESNNPRYRNPEGRDEEAAHAA